MNKAIVELIGTFFLVLAIGLNVLGGGAIPPLAIAAMLMAMIYAGGHISGAHYNPAVTIAVTLRGKCAPSDVVPYIIAQIAGGAAAAFAVKFIVGAEKMAKSTALDIAKSGGIGPVFLAELLFTFALVWVILNVATSKGTQGNGFYGLAISFTVLAGAFSVGHVSGGAFNPAVAIAAALMGGLKFGDIWIHITADIAGGILAALAFKSLSSADRE